MTISAETIGAAAQSFNYEQVCDVGRRVTRVYIRNGQQVGDYWKPGEDPYSIPLDGEVARIFAKYGFKQGAYWNSGAKDYMHFSFFGT